MEEQMEIQVSQEQGRVPVTVMHVNGNIDSSTYEAFQAKAIQLINDGTRYLLVDLSHAPFISSAGLRALHQIFLELRAVHPDANLSDQDLLKGIGSGTYKSPHLKLLNLSKNAGETFKMGGFDLYIEACTDLKTAIASF
jgi:anti-anti-sigma factor